MANSNIVAIPLALVRHAESAKIDGKIRSSSMEEPLNHRRSRELGAAAVPASLRTVSDQDCDGPFVIEVISEIERRPLVCVGGDLCQGTE